MTDSLIIKGFWFLPNNDKDKTPGSLFFTPYEEIRLELIGGLNFKIQDLFQNESLETIHGISNEGEKITLFFCSGSGSISFSSSFPLMNYQCRYLIKGKHLSSFSEAAFNSAQVDFSFLYNWYPAGRIKCEISKNENYQKINALIDESTYWEEFMKIDDDYSLKLFGTAYFNGSFDNKNITLRQNTIFEVFSNNSNRSISDLIKKIEVFRQFLSLASLSTIEYLNIELYDNDEDQQSESGKNLLKASNLIMVTQEDRIKKTNNPEFLFTHNDIAEIFPEVIIKWYNFEESLAPIRNHLIESIKNKSVFTSLDFLIIVQALEGFHRRFISPNRIELKTRIKEIYNMFNNIEKLNNPILNIDQVVNTRGYYSHFYENNINSIEGIELYNITKQLRILLICCVLQLIGFSKDLITKLINKNSKL